MAKIYLRNRGRYQSKGFSYTEMPISRNKYKNKKITVDGKVFDSVREHRRYEQLKTLEKAGYISDLQTQVKFVLIPAQYVESSETDKKGRPIKGKLLERECSYIADFVYLQNGEKVVEDTKGFKTKDYILKRKMMLYFHNIRIKEI